MSPECPNCGAHVTPDWARVASDNDGNFKFCPHCPGVKKRGAIDAVADEEERDTNYSCGPDWLRENGN